MKVKKLSGPTVECKIDVGYLGSQSRDGNPMQHVVAELDCGCILDIVGDFFVSIRHVECSVTCTERHSQRKLEAVLTPKFLGARTMSVRAVYWEKLINRLLAYGEDLKGKKK